MVLLALGFLTPYFAFIPKASLAAVIISAVIFMIEYEVVKPMWRSSKKDLIATCATFVFCLAIGVEYGILVGVGINIMFLLYPSARPSVYVEKMKVQHWRKAMLSCFTLSSLFADCDEWYRVRYDYSRE
jgi:sodium-independent sulfate anion transporter 11